MYIIYIRRTSPVFLKAGAPISIFIYKHDVSHFSFDELMYTVLSLTGQMSSSSFSIQKIKKSPENPLNPMYGALRIQMFTKKTY
jgi:hypothetical protein